MSSQARNLERRIRNAVQTKSMMLGSAMPYHDSDLNAF
jgi:hypothetical protein